MKKLQPPHLKLSVFPDEPLVPQPTQLHQLDLNPLHLQLENLSKSNQKRVLELQENQQSVKEWLKIHSTNSTGNAGSNSHNSPHLTQQDNSVKLKTRPKSTKNKESQPCKYIYCLLIMNGFVNLWYSYSRSRSIRVSLDSLIASQKKIK